MIQPKKDSIDAEFDRIEQLIKRLEVEYSVYFQGARKIPPEDMRRQLDGLIRKFRNTDLNNFGLRFRFSSLMSSYTTHTERWKRRLELKEKGETQDLQVRKPGMPSSGGGGHSVRRNLGSKAAESGLGDIEKPQVISSMDDDHKIQALFDDYVATKKRAGESTSKLTYKGFQKVINKQLTSIRKKSGADKVKFRVQLKNGKVSLKAGRNKE